MEPTVLETHCEWTAADVADPTTWTRRFSDAEIAELETALAVARARHDDLLDVTRDDFPLPTLSPVLAGLAHQLVEGRGFVRLAGLPVQRWGVEDSCWVYWGLGRHLGEPWPQNARGHVLGDVRDQGRSPDDPEARGNEIGGAALGFHTDGSDLVALLCLDPGVSGGESLVVDAVGAHNALVRAEPELAAELYAHLPYDFRGEQPPDSPGWYRVPVFTAHRGRLFVRYIRPYIEASQRHPDAPRLTERQRAAMDAYDAVLADPDRRVEMRLEPGDIQIVDNYHVLHGRRSYRDDPATGRVRHLKRLWLATDALGPEDRPARFARPGVMAHWGRVRTRT
ncbi:MAG: taurine catabolism dioxygenase TauD [Actinomyces sp.]|nr:MAG: taurine catabolism dioxygenase TauD [Actinomyces sp.]